MTELKLLDNYIEALIFCASNPIKNKEIKKCLEEHFESNFSENEIDDILSSLMEKFSGDQYSFHIIQSAGGYIFKTKEAYHSCLQALIKQKSKKRLSTAAMEILAIIAYKQPITKIMVEKIRGVNSDYGIKRLLEKGLVEITGKSNELGKPLLYSTTEKFMEYFNINHISELPKPKDFSSEENKIGDELEG